MDTAPPFLLAHVALRAAAVTLLLLTAALLVRDQARSLAARLGAAFALGVAANVLRPGEGNPPPWQWPVIALAAGNPLLFWLFVRALFDDAFRWRHRHVAGWVALAALGLVHCVVLVPRGSPWTPTTGALLTAAPLVFAALAVVQSLSSWHTDLVEKRRRLRLFIVAAASGHIVLTSAARLVLPAPGAQGIDASALVAIVAVIVWQLLRVPSSGLFPEDAVAPDDAPVAVDAPAFVPDTALLADLDRLMTQEMVHLGDTLSIGALANRLGVPEYRLRRQINQGLGHRNFNAFLNTYRLAEAKRRLADPRDAAVPVLTIAVESGFQSLGPFNRAFKADTGLTPTEFRRNAATAPAGSTP